MPSASNPAHDSNPQSTVEKPSRQDNSHPPVKHHQDTKQSAAKVPLTSLSDSQRFLLIEKLHTRGGNTVRLIRVGSEPQANIVFEQLDYIFEQAGWPRQNAEVGQVTVVGQNFPTVTYLSGADMSSELLSTVFSIFSSMGLDVPITPNAYIGPASMGPPPEVVVVVR